MITCEQELLKALTRLMSINSDFLFGGVAGWIFIAISLKSKIPQLFCWLMEQTNVR